MKHYYLFLTFLVITVGGISIYFSINLYKKTKIPYLKLHNIVLLLLNYQILCGLIFDYYFFNLFTGSEDMFVSILTKLYILQLSIIIVLLSYVLIKIFYIIQNEEINKIVSNILFIFYFVSISFQLIITFFSVFGDKTNQTSLLITLLLYFFYLIVILYFSLRLVFKKFKKSSKIQSEGIKHFALFFLITTSSLILFFLLRVLNYIDQDLTNILTTSVQLSMNLIPLIYLKDFIKKVFPDQLPNHTNKFNKKEIIKKYNISKRETEIIDLICQGFSNKEIEEKLFISIRTVKDHIYNIYKKTGIKNRVQLTNIFKNS